MLSKLQHIWLNNNQFSGILPFEIGKMKSLKSIFIYHNNFVGPIPQTVGNIRELEIFYGQNNSFGGNVPQELWFLPKLKMLRLEMKIIKTKNKFRMDIYEWLFRN